MPADLHQQLFQLQTEADFERCALAVFRFQATHNAVYRDFLAYLGKKIEQIKEVDDIPFLPIELFKTQRILVGEQVEQVFTSSGTTGITTSRHFVADLKLYTESFSRCFERFYGTVSQYAVLALLPNYLERGGSSLVFMAKELI